MIALEILAWGFLLLLAVGIFNAIVDGFVASCKRLQRDIERRIDEEQEAKKGKPILNSLPANEDSEYADIINKWRIK
jgi:hypothetical protein